MELKIEAIKAKAALEIARIQEETADTIES
jgi:hypothetical protein